MKVTEILKKEVIHCPTKDTYDKILLMMYNCWWNRRCHDQDEWYNIRYIMKEKTTLKLNDSWYITFWSKDVHVSVSWKRTPWHSKIYSANKFINENTQKKYTITATDEQRKLIEKIIDNKKQRKKNS